MNPAGRIEARYSLERGDFALDVDVTIPLHGITGVFGESGAGKTSLLRCIAGLERDAKGSLVVDGEAWQDASSRRAVHDREIGYVFQEPRLFPHLDVLGNLDYGRRRTKREPLPFNDVVALLGLGELLGRRPATLSGGEAQRVAIARALLRAPRFVLMDEPLASLDRARRAEILPFLDRLHAELSIPIVYVSHDIREIARLCDHLLVMQRGRIVASGELAEVLLRTDLPLLAGEEAGAVLRAVAVDYDETFGLTRARFPGGEFRVAGRHAAGSELRLRIRANDVSLCRERPGVTTILNVLDASIDAIEPESTTTNLVTLRLGDDRILARITRRSASDLGLAPGDHVFAQIKSVAVRTPPQRG